MGAVIVYGIAIVGFIIFIKGLYVRTVDLKKKNEIRNTNKKDKKKLKKDLKQKYKAAAVRLQENFRSDMVFFQVSLAEKNKENE